MKKFGYSFMFFLLFLCHTTAFAQVQFTYDQRGNRIGRVLTLSKQTDSVIHNDTIDRSIDIEFYTDTLGELSYSVFPNPTKGSIIVNVSGNTESKLPGYALYNLQGKKVGHQDEIKPGFFIINLSNEESGVYLLVINYDSKQRVWKIIKE